jgi:hypothetical protein
MFPRYRALAGHCARALRLDLLLLVSHHLSALGGASYVLGEGEGPGEAHPALGALTRWVGGGCRVVAAGWWLQGGGCRVVAGGWWVGRRVRKGAQEELVENCSHRH